MKIIAVIQARMNSTRLPFKSVLPLCGKPMVQHILERVKRASLVDDVILAIPDERGNDLLRKCAKDADVDLFVENERVPYRDLIACYMEAASKYHPTFIVRIGGDNPCVQASEIDRIIQARLRLMAPIRVLYTNAQEVKNSGYPDGLGAEIYDYPFLRWLDESQTDLRYREHPHLWAYEHGALETIKCPRHFARPNLRLDVNTQDDFNFIRDIYEHCYPKNHNFAIIDILNYLETPHGKKLHQSTTLSIQQNIAKWQETSG